MAYITETGLRSYCRPDRYDELMSSLDFDDAAAATAFVTGTIIAQADAMVDSYVAKLYTVPLTGTRNLSLAQKWSYAIAQFLLYQRSGFQAIPEKVALLHEQAVDELRDVSSGRSILDMDDNEPAAGSVGTTLQYSGPTPQMSGDNDLGQWI